MSEGWHVLTDSTSAVIDWQCNPLAGAEQNATGPEMPAIRGGTGVRYTI